MWRKREWHSPAGGLEAAAAAIQMGRASAGLAAACGPVGGQCWAAASAIGCRTQALAGVAAATAPSGGHWVLAVGRRRAEAVAHWMMAAAIGCRSQALAGVAAECGPASPGVAAEHVPALAGVAAKAGVADGGAESTDDPLGR